MAHFPTLRTEKPTDTKKHAEEILILQQEFSSQFQDFRKHETAFSLFSTPFDVDVETVSDEFQLEIIDLQCIEDLKSKFRDSILFDFYKLYLPGDKLPALRNHARQMTSLFGSTYLCEQFFSKVNIVKNTSRNTLDDERLESCLRVATSQICPDINIFVAKKQCQSSH
jgi:hypothetical protein